MRGASGFRERTDRLSTYSLFSFCQGCTAFPLPILKWFPFCHLPFPGDRHRRSGGWLNSDTFQTRKIPHRFLECIENEGDPVFLEISTPSSKRKMATFASNVSKRKTEKVIRAFAKLWRLPVRCRYPPLSGRYKNLANARSALSRSKFPFWCHPDKEKYSSMSGRPRAGKTKKRNSDPGVR